MGSKSLSLVVISFKKYGIGERRQYLHFFFLGYSLLEQTVSAMEVVRVLKIIDVPSCKCHGGTGE